MSTASPLVVGREGAVGISELARPDKFNCLSLAVLESMKTELHVTAPFDGSVASVRCKVGDMVERRQVLAEVAPLE